MRVTGDSRVSTLLFRMVSNEFRIWKQRWREKLNKIPKLL